MDGGGQVVGYGCNRGTEGKGCVATIYNCNIQTDLCKIAMVTTETGTMLAMDRRCEILSRTEPSFLSSRGVPTIAEEAM